MQLTKITSRRPWLIIEIILFVLAGIGLYIFLDKFARGGPLSTDVIGYANVGLKGLGTPPIINRYFHVFFQAVFLKLASSPLAGMQHFWAFLTAGTAGMIYLAGRLFSRRSQPWHGLLAVAIFFSIAEVAESAGVTYVDVTAAFMMMIFIVMYIISARNGHGSSVLLVLLGFLLYLAFRTKETTLLAGIVLLGLGMGGEKPFEWKLFMRRFVYVVSGIFAGLIFFIILNAILLHDPLFGFRISDYTEFFSVYVSNLFVSTASGTYGNWFTKYLFVSLLVPFLLYLVSATKSVHEADSYPGMRLLWLIPLAVVLFVTISVSRRWGFSPRYIYTIFPFVSFLGPQFLDLDLTATASKKQRLLFALVFVGSLVLIVATRVAIRFILPRMGWDLVIFMEMVFIPVILVIILGLTFYWKMPSRVVSIIISILILAVISIPLAGNIKQVVRDHPNLTAAQQLFYPFSAFPGEVRYSADMQMYVSLNVWQEFGQTDYVKDRNELSALFNLYYGADSSRYNFALPTETGTITSDLLSASYNYVLMSRMDWNTVALDAASASQIENNYQVLQEDKNQFTLLVRK